MIGYGTSNLHHNFRSTKVQSLLDFIYDCGIKYFDTAPTYGYGVAESELGKFSRRREITIATKVGLYSPLRIVSYKTSCYTRKALGKFYRKLNIPLKSNSIEIAQKSIWNSLKLLHRDFLDVLYLHDPDLSFCKDDWLEFAYKNRNIVKKFGVCGDNYSEFRFFLNSGLYTLLQSNFEGINAFQDCIHIEKSVYGIIRESKQLDFQKLSNEDKSKIRVIFSSSNPKNICQFLNDFR